MITIEIGKEPTTKYAIHEALAVSKSDYFRTAFKGTWKEVQEGQVHFEEDHPHVWAIFVEWLYCGSIPSDTLPCKTIDHNDDTAPAVDFLRESLKHVAKRYPQPATLPTYSSKDWLRPSALILLISAFALGDRLQCAKFKNAIIDHLIWNQHISTRNSTPSCSDIRYCFESTTPNSKLKVLLTHLKFYRGSDEELLSNMCTSQHSGIFFELAMLQQRQINLATRLTTEGPFTRDAPAICQFFHEHGDEEDLCQYMNRYPRSLFD